MPTTYGPNARALAVVVAVALVLVVGSAGAQDASEAAAKFETSLAVEEMTAKQAVVETDRGPFIIDLLAEAAPNHVGYFIKSAAEGVYSGTSFHRMVRHGIVQGGDPMTKDVEKPELYGQGGLGVLAAELSDEPHTRGAVSAAQIPGDPDSAGSQFFISVVDQPALDGSYTVFGRVIEGMNLVTEISEAETDESGKAVERIAIRSVTIRDRPAEQPAPFSEDSAEELAAYRAILGTTSGAITLEFMPEIAPEHVRNFLRLASVGVFDGMSFHRVVGGMLIQSGWLGSRNRPLDERQRRLVTTLEPEFSATPHVRGIVSMARGDDPASADTSFFICTDTVSALDGEYTVFARVVDGMETVDAIESLPLEGETPMQRVEILGVQVAR
ncbi:MAG: peptidylprolyl isomerase [Vicinamibacterales bacterium]|nr:peptidylprolyl isomerase [Vicinamibacterales bacterium]MDP6608207.1 peptidylprolyl isomerase [Vicinamibacterales bacterium]